MKTVGMVLIGLLVLGAFAFWVRATMGLPHFSTPTIASLVNNGAPALQAASVSGAQVVGEYVDISGRILIDETGGTPVPFIEYIDANHHVATKQLVYANRRGCAPAAGDIPCIDVDPSASYPQYPPGTNVRVRGLHVDDRILVYQIDVL